jgi:hypothetical protein
MHRRRGMNGRRPTGRRISWPVALLLLAWAAAAGSVEAAPARPAPCARTPENLIGNCDFAAGTSGWRAQAATTISWERRLGHHGAGALRMVNEPASEAGAVTCVEVSTAGPHELAGMLRRVSGGPGECLVTLAEHDTADCSGGAIHFHEMVSAPLAAGTFTRVSGSVDFADGTASVTAGFACYGAQDDVVGEVLLDEVVLRPLAPVADSDSR